MLDAAVNPENGQAVIITDAKAPFDSPDAELIIRSSDNVDFRVFKTFLSVVSSVFKDMFALPQRPAGVSEGDQEMRDGLPVIQITEESRIVETLLRFCYPNILTSIPVLKTMDDILPMLEVASKYGIESLESLLRAALFSPSVVETGAMKLFVVAYQHRWEKEMRVAARHTLSQPAWDRLYVAELELITGGDLHRLQQYRLKCRTAATQVATKFLWIRCGGGAYHWLMCSSCEDTTKVIEFTGWFNVERVRPGGWWTRYTEAAAKELATRPFGNTVLEPKLVDMALQQAHSCQDCSQKMGLKEGFKNFCDVFAAKVEEAVSRVTLEVRL